MRVFPSEAAMLQAWQAFFDHADPDAIALYQVSSLQIPCCLQRTLLLHVDPGMDHHSWGICSSWESDAGMLLTH